ncbi:MAG TPA: hypothetical protein VFK44_09590 [Bacillales bacterium]|nr:hypothetical protein [Bacillales bacterium]
MKKTGMAQNHQRHPFVMLDVMEVTEDGTRVSGRKRVTAGDAGMPGGRMPAGLVLEALAQTAGPVLDRGGGARSAEGAEAGANAAPAAERWVLAGVEACRMGRRRPEAGEAIETEVEVVRRRRAAVKVSARARVGGVMIAEAELRFVRIG